MGKFFNIDSPVWRFMSKIADMFWLNILWFVCCIPIVTIGPSTTALYYVELKLVRDEEGKISQQFFHSFKENLKQGMIIGVIVTIGYVLLGVDIYFYAHGTNQMSGILWIVTLVFAVYFFMMSLYIFGLLAKFVNTVKNLFLFGFMLPIKHIGFTLLMALSTLAIVFVTFYIFPPMIFLFMGLIAYINSKCLVHIFDRYINKEDDEDDEEEDEIGEEPVHIVLDADHPEHVVIGDPTVSQIPTAKKADRDEEDDED